MKLLVLGQNGMLGHMVVKYLSESFEIETINGRWPSTKFQRAITESDADVVINCIGAIPQRTDQFAINYQLPQWLDDNFNGKVIHPGTDCEMDEDAYGISKKLARDYIIKNGTKTKIIKSSIIGPEIDSQASLLEWFLSQGKSVNGYTEAYWNGITTLQWAKECKQLLENWDDYNTETIIEGTCLSKFELLKLIAKVFDRTNKIVPKNPIQIDKCLAGDILSPSIEQQLIELKQYYYDNRK